MCGIFAYTGSRHNAPELILNGLKVLEYRGYDSWGIAVEVVDDTKTDKKTIRVEKHIGKIGEAKTNLPQSSIGIGHTRWATHGGVTKANAHPHLDDTGTIAVVHNGIVENYQELKATLTAHKHTFASETDSEVIAHVLEEQLSHSDFKTALCKTFSSLVGANAICILNTLSQEVGVCRDGSPIVIGIGDNEYFVGSDVTAFLPYTKRVVFLNDGEGAMISSKGFSIFTTHTGEEINPKITTIDWEPEEAQKNGYPHYLLKEIMEQVHTIPKTARLNDHAMYTAIELIKNAGHVMITGCGTAGFCALAAKYLFSAYGIPVEIFGAYEASPALAFADKETVLIAISQSGETADTLLAVKKAQEKGAKVIAVINARGSTLERRADLTLMVGSGPEIAVVSTKAFTAQLATLYRLAALCGALPVAHLKTHAAGSRRVAVDAVTDEVIAAGLILETWLDDDTLQKIKQLAHALCQHEHVYIIGKDLQYPAAMECALKIKEASYIHAEAFASGELKHGVIALIEAGTPCIVVGAKDGYESDLRAAAAEVKARGGWIIGIAPFEAPEFNDIIKTPNLGKLTLLGNIIVGQLLGYYCAIARGADPDKPRNLAKSVTVK